VIFFNNVLNYQRVCKENNLHIYEEALPCKQDHGGSIPAIQPYEKHNLGF
jgi:hypothetical protein